MEPRGGTDKSDATHRKCNGDCQKGGMGDEYCGGDGQYIISRTENRNERI